MNFLSDPVPFLTDWLNGLLAGWGLSTGLVHFISYIIGGGILATAAMLLVLFLIWLERKLIGRIQDRLGPNRVGPFGLFQTLADMLKIFIKEHITPEGADRVPYELGPVLSVAAVLMVWAVLPFARTTMGTDLSVGLLFIFAVGSIGELAVILAGWGSNNKYALLGSFRAVALLISYSIPMLIVLLVPVMLAGSLRLNDLVQAQNVWYIVLAPVPALIFFISSVAEVGRSPFDLTEAESEIVSGFNIEYSGLKFGMFYVADFLHAFTISLIFSTIFLGGWRGPAAEQIPILGFVYYLVKTSVVYFLVVLMRGTLPRLRIDQMNNLNWKFLTPFSLLSVIVFALADKILPNSLTLGRVLVLLAANALILVAMLGGMNWFSAHRRRPVVVTRRRHEIAPHKDVSA
jgi:NADH-quinone oxidoreductase subunit H